MLLVILTFHYFRALFKVQSSVLLLASLRSGEAVYMFLPFMSLEL